MLRVIVCLLALTPFAAFAQMADSHGMMMDHHAMMVSHPAGGAPTEPGQSAFAAIQEIVTLLEADPKTDWAKVDIEALRRHLIDMDNVTLHAQVRNEKVEGGDRFVVTGTGAVRDSIQRMALAHAATMDGVDGWRFQAVATDDGADLTVLVPAKDLAKLQALGFIGVMTRGMHHQMHHLMIARGEHPH